MSAAHVLVVGDGPSGHGLYVYRSAPPNGLQHFAPYRYLSSIAAFEQNQYLGMNYEVVVRKAASGATVRRLRNAGPRTLWYIGPIAVTSDVVYATANGMCIDSYACGADIAAYHSGSSQPFSRISWPGLGLVSSLATDSTTNAFYVAWLDTARNTHVSHYADGQLVDLLNGPAGAYPAAIAIGTDGNLIVATGGTPTTPGALDVVTPGGKIVRKIANVKYDPMLALSADGSRLFFADTPAPQGPSPVPSAPASKIRVYDYASGKTVASFGAFSNVESMAIGQ